MPALQLELDFKQQLQGAQTNPLEAKDWAKLWATYDAQLSCSCDANVPRIHVDDQIAFHLDEICELIEVFSAYWIEQLTYPAKEEPVLLDEYLADLFVQERPLDLGDLIAEPELYVRSPSSKSDEVEGTVVEYKDKSVVLAEIESSAEFEEQAGEEVALKASHEEDVSAWVGAIALYLEKAEGVVTFAELVKGLGMPVVAVWLGLLLGGFRVEQRGGFYGGEVWVGCY